jgi:hypothetical protein
LTLTAINTEFDTEFCALAGEDDLRQPWRPDVSS